MRRGAEYDTALKTLVIQIAACRQVLAAETETDLVFLASQFAAVMAGFFHHDECLTVVQAIGLQALLRGLGTARGQ